jgi:prevent-host-death family protein
MKTIGVYEAKTHLPQLLNEVAKGETIVITKHGEEIAHLVPAGRARQDEISQAIENIKKVREKNILGDDLTIRMLIEEGRE